MTARGIPATVIRPNARLREFRRVGLSDSEILTVARRGDPVFARVHGAVRQNAVIAEIVVSNMGLGRGVVIPSRMPAQTGNSGTDLAFRQFPGIVVITIIFDLDLRLLVQPASAVGRFDCQSNPDPCAVRGFSARTRILARVLVVAVPLWPQLGQRQRPIFLGRSED